MTLDPDHTLKDLIQEYEDRLSVAHKAQWATLLLEFAEKVEERQIALRLSSENPLGPYRSLQHKRDDEVDP